MRLSKRWLQAVALVVSLVLIVAAVACAAPATPTPTPTTPKTTAPASTTPSPTASPKPSASPTPTASPTPAKAIVIKFSIISPAGAAYSEASSWVTREFERLSGGRVKIEYYYSQSLTPAKEALTAVRTGVADLAMLVPGYAPGQVPLSGIGELPGLVTDLWSGIHALNDYVELPEIKAEFAGNNVVYFAGLGTSGHEIISRKPITKITDLKGMKIAADGEQLRLLAALGASPTTVIAGERYEALQRGTVDASHQNPVYATTYKLQEVAKYWYTLPLGAKPYCNFMNLDTWNKLGPELQQLSISLRNQAGEKFYEMYEVAGDGQAMKDILAAGVQVTKATTEDIAEMQRVAMDTIWKGWVEDKDKKGLAGQKLLDKWLELNKLYQAKRPK